MKTVITPEALAKSKTFKQCKLSDWRKINADELFLFIFPSSDPFNEENGDGDLIEILDFNDELTEVGTDVGDVKVTPDTVIYYR